MRKLLYTLALGTALTLAPWTGATKTACAQDVWAASSGNYNYYVVSETVRATGNRYSARVKVDEGNGRSFRMDKFYMCDSYGLYTQGTDGGWIPVNGGFDLGIFHTILNLSQQ
ncbi:MAG: hypothetical protein K6F01_03835 [Selenomonas sp.]|uniref:hypothetical protein n=1 Tax=Selenomonas sp. TaxID=2053611 RepID=UPI0025F8A6EE|nr:hypothetical protein [Selenomonas sp.]MCR5438551.1 hypothetical protein [Selenomonas sp.]